MVGKGSNYKRIYLHCNNLLALGNKNWIYEYVGTVSRLRGVIIVIGSLFHPLLSIGSLLCHASLSYASLCQVLLAIFCNLPTAPGRWSANSSEASLHSFCEGTTGIIVIFLIKNNYLSSSSGFSAAGFFLYTCLRNNF